MTPKDSLGDRMKRYETASRSMLVPRTPVILRVDGRAFHTYTRGCNRPFDVALADVMCATAARLCEEISGAQTAYTQSDEISIFVHPYKTFASQAWFGNQIQKIASVAAGIASATFTAASAKIWGHVKPAVFDARAFTVPEADVCNYFIWRQQDASRNSVQMLARSLYSHKECHKKNNSALQEMCFQAGENWNALPSRFKRGSCIRKDDGWVVDHEIPIFTSERGYINDLLSAEQ